MKRKISVYAIAITISLPWLIWLAVLTNENTFKHLFETGDNNFYALSGAFGDSFGFVASLMTMIAAVGVYVTFSNEQHARTISQFESNFFTLLKNLESITSQIQVELLKNRKDSTYKAKYHPLLRVGTRIPIRTLNGREGLKVILFVIRNGIGPEGYSNIKVVSRNYNETYNKFVHFLGHYFRTVYHIYRLIDEKCPKDDGLSYHYARIVRSQLSNPELCLLAYNCIVGEGRHKFRYLAEKYAIFHNMHRELLDEYEQPELDFFLRKLHCTAFRFEPIVPITFDD